MAAPGRSPTDGLVVDAAAGAVANRWTAAGTHAGQFLGVPPTGRRLSLHGHRHHRC